MRLFPCIRTIVSFAVVACAAYGIAPAWARDGRPPVTGVAAPTPPEPLLTTAAAVRRLNRPSAGAHPRVRLQGVVTYFDEDWDLLFVNDRTGGVFVFPADTQLRVRAGDLVIVEGHAVVGDFARSIGEGHVTVVGRAPLPPTVAVPVEPLRAGAYDSQRLVLEGVVRSLRFPVQNQHLMLDVLVNGQRVLAQFPGPWNGPLPTALVDARVRLHGVCGTIFGQQGQILGLQMFLVSLDDVEVVRPASALEAVPTRSAGALLESRTLEATDHRVRTRGVVTYVQGRRLYLQDGSGAVQAALVRPEALAPGTAVELAGFPSAGSYGALLEDAVVISRPSMSVEAVRPAVALTTDLAAGKLHGHLVTVDARLVDSVFSPTTRVLVLLASGRNFVASLAPDAPAWDDPPEPGSRVTVTGVSEAEVNRDFDPLNATSFRLLLRSADDVVVTERPPLWTRGHTLALGLGLALAGLVVTGWLVALRRQVRAQTRAAEARLQHEMDLQERYRDLFENANDVVCTWDAQGRITSINRAGEQVLGYPRADARSMFITDLVAPEHGHIVRTSLSRTLLSRRGTTFEVDLVTRTGARVTIEFDARPVEQRGQVSGVQAIGRDVTSRKRAEAELQRARDAAEAASRAKSQFVANVSHEVRTPMNGILGLTELLLEGPLGDEQRQHLAMVKASADSLLHVINDVLDFSRIEAGRVDLHPVAFDLREQAADVMQPLAVAARKKNLHLSLRVAPDAPQRVLADGDRLRQVLVNICGNAVKFTPAGEVSLDVRLERGDAGHGSRTMLVFRVRDTGIGIPAAKHRDVFGAFTQADGSTSRRFGGTGLGLAISSSLVQLMGGSIELESAEGQGSTFTVHVPVIVPAEQPAGDRLPPGTVVVVEPNVSTREALVERLGAWGATVHAVADVASLEAAVPADAGDGVVAAVVAVEALRTSPGEFGSLWRRLAPGAGLVVTALAAQPGDVRAARTAGASALLARPLRETALVAALRSRGAGLAEVPDGQRDPESFVRRNILLAEDNPVNQRLVVHVLERRGHVVRVAGDGREALELLERWRPDLVLMDVQMPELNGLEATAAIRARELKSGDHLPIVAMTAHAMEGDRERCLQAGMDDYLTKPIGAPALIQAVERIVDSFVTPIIGRSDQPEPAQTTSADEVPVDRAAALKRVDGDAELLSEIVDLFLADVEPLTEDIRAAVAARDATRIMRSSHRLKGSVATLAAKPAADAALRLEIMGRGSDLADADAAFAALEFELKRLVPALRAFVQDAAA
jgi:PAS domain S-box-containing protein